MRVSKFVVPALVVGLLLGTVLVAQAQGWWIVSGKEMVDVGNLQSSDDIKGWMSFQQVADGLGIEVPVLYARLGLPADLPPETALKEMESLIPGFEVTTVREAVDAHLAGVEGPVIQDTPPAESPVAPAATPAPTAEATSTAGAALDSQGAEVAATPYPTSTPAPADHTPIGDGTGEGQGDGSGLATPVVAGALDPAEIKGRHTLSEVAEGTGVTVQELLTALNLPANTAPETQLRDLVESGALGEIDAVRTAIADLVAAR